jgi:hypothetical protein
VTDEPNNHGWLNEMEERARALLTAQASSWESVAQEVRRVKAKLNELGERVESDLTAAIDTSWLELKERVKDKVLRNDFVDLTRKELRIAARLLFEIPIPTLRALVAAKRGSHAMLLDAFCNEWTDRRDHPARRELAALVMGAPPGVRLLHRGIAIDLGDQDAPAKLTGRGPPDLAKLVELLRTLGCRTSWQFSSEAIAASISTIAGRTPRTVWSQLTAQPRDGSIVLPALSEKRWADGWPIGGGTAPVRTQVTVVIALLQVCLEYADAASDVFLDKLLRFSRFGDPRMSLSPHWQELRNREPDLFHEFLGRLVRDDLKLFFQHAMTAKDREEFWLLYIRTIRRTVAVLAKDTRLRLEQALRGTKEGRGVIERTCLVPTGRLNAFCLYFEKVVVVEFSEVGNAAYLYPRDVFEAKVFPPNSTPPSAAALRRRDVPHARILHSTDWQSEAARVLREYGIHPSRF